ncbi:hypothetical protein ACFE04_008611 [Oxalis oulophora]
MASAEETQDLVEADISKHQKSSDDDIDGSLNSRRQQQPTNKTSKLMSFFMEPFQWLQMLSTELNPTFLLGIFIVYGLSQGFAGSFFKVVTDYYWKDVQKVQPSVVQLYMGLYYIPWIMKPVWGLFTDVYPIWGYRRRPYFIVAGVVGLVSALSVALLGKLSVPMALGCLIGIAGGVAIADVVIDACIARNSIKMKALASDMQSLCGVCSSTGSLVGFATSGLSVHHFGAQGALVMLAIPPALLIVLGFVIYEVKLTNLQSKKKKVMQTGEELRLAITSMFETIKLPGVWKPSLYMFLSLALSISTHEGQFYWYTDPKAGPAFSQEFVGFVYAMGALASIIGVIIYQKNLKDYPFRTIIFSAQLLYAVLGMLDIIFVLRWNLKLGIPDAFFIITEQSISHIVTRIRWLPMIVLSTRLCPVGIEGTFFALLMCIDSFGSLTSKSCGGIVLHVFHVTRTDFTNLWLVIMIRNFLRFVTLCLIFLVPAVEQTEDLLPTGHLANRASLYEDEEEEEGLQLVTMK